MLRLGLHPCGEKWFQKRKQKILSHNSVIQFLFQGVEQYCCANKYSGIYSDYSQTYHHRVKIFLYDVSDGKFICRPTD